MNSKIVKKLRKEARRQVNVNFGEGMEAMNKLIRLRPSFVPRFIWILLYVPLFRVKYLRAIYRYL